MLFVLDIGGSVLGYCGPTRPQLEILELTLIKRHLGQNRGTSNALSLRKEQEHEFWDPTAVDQEGSHKDRQGPEYGSTTKNLNIPYH